MSFHVYHCPKCGEQTLCGPIVYCSRCNPEAGGGLVIAMAIILVALLLFWLFVG